MQIGILEINRESIITMMNMVQYLLNSRHLTSRYVHVVIESLNIKYGNVSQSICLGTTNTLKWKPVLQIDGSLALFE